MKYHIRGKNQTVILADSDFIDAGGEGKVYKYGSKVCKIYFNVSHMIPDGKIVELSRLTRPNIIKPEDVLVDGKGIPVGITMRTASGHPLCKLFTNGFRTKNNIGNVTIQDISKIIVETVSSIHKARCLIVDGNELSYIVSPKFDDVFFIDVDSYGTPSFAPTAFHPNTKDIHNNSFSELTDWFSVGIVICWLYVGVHPYKGKHPKYKKKGIDGMLERMRDNISIFNSGIKLAPTARDFSCIPTNYKGWFIDMFENGNRCPPPGLPGRIILTPVYTKIVKGTDNFDIILLKEFKGEILLYKKIYGIDIAVTKEIVNQDSKYDYFINSRKTTTSKSNMDVILSKLSLTPAYVLKVTEGFDLRVDGFSDKTYGCSFGSSKFVLDNTMYIKNYGYLNSVELTETKFKNTSKFIATVRNTWNIMPNSSIMMDGFLYQKALGKSFLYIPVPSKNQCIALKVPEIENYRIVGGKYDNRVCMLIGRKGSTYDKIILRLTDTLASYDCRIIEDVDIDSINFVVLDSGICASMEDTNTLELFRNVPNDSGLKSITDPAIKSSMKLWKDGTRLLFSDNNKLYIIKMRNR